MQLYEAICAIGQDSHRFASQAEMQGSPDQPLRLAGIDIAGARPLSGNSDADVILHALTNAISGLSGVNILGPRSDKLCLEQGITDSAVYLQEALDTLGEWELRHVSISVECKNPRLVNWIEPMKARLADLCGLVPGDIGLTATSGEGLTAFGRGEGIQVFCQVTARRRIAQSD